MTAIITHPDYADARKKWLLVNDACSETGIKDGGKTYLPFIGDWNDDIDRERYNNYLQRAVFYGFSAETLSGLTGLAFKNGITLEDAEESEYINSDINGDGVGLEQQAQSVTQNVIKNGRAGLFVDYPPVEGTPTAAQIAQEGIRATITQYSAVQIKNWHTMRVGAQTVLSLVSLEEDMEKVSEDGITVERMKVERRLILDEDGYRVELHWTEGKDTEMMEVYEPKNSTGERLKYIPFYFIGSTNNDHNIDYVPMYSIADLNVGHYRNSADYENSVFLLQPQPWATGLEQSWVNEYLKGFRMGSGSLLPLPEGCQFGIEQPEPNQQSFEAMGYKQKSMIALGAKLITADISFNTLGEAVIANASQNSKLQMIINNVETGYNDAFVALAEFNGTKAPVMTINADLDNLASDPQTANIIVQGWMAGLIATTDARNYMRKTGLIDRTDEEIDGDIETESTGEVNLDDE